MKKILCVLLAALCLLCAAACDREKDQDPDPGTQQTQPDKPDGEEQKPTPSGLPAEEELLAAFQEAPFDRMSVTGSFGTEETFASSERFTASVSGAVSGEESDLLLSLDETGEYFLGFVRGGELYADGGAWGETACGDFDALFERYRNDAALSRVETGDLTIGWETLLSRPVFGTLLRNLGPTGGKVTRLGAEYTLTYDLATVLGGAFADLEEALLRLRGSSALADALALPETQKLLSFLFDGVFAADLLSVLPKEFGLPEAGESSVPEYLALLLASEEFSSSLGVEGTLGELTLDELLALSGSEDSYETFLPAATFAIEVCKDSLRNLDLILRFDKEKTPKSFSLDGDAVWVGRELHFTRIELSLAFVFETSPQLLDLSGMRYSVETDELALCEETYASELSLPEGVLGYSFTFAVREGNRFEASVTCAELSESAEIDLRELLSEESFDISVFGFENGLVALDGQTAYCELRLSFDRAAGLRVYSRPSEEELPALSCKELAFPFKREYFVFES